MATYGAATRGNVELYPNWLCWECDHQLLLHKGESNRCELCQRCRIPDIPANLEIVKVGEVKKK